MESAFRPATGDNTIIEGVTKEKRNPFSKTRRGMYRNMFKRSGIYNKNKHKRLYAKGRKSYVFTMQDVLDASVNPNCEHLFYPETYEGYEIFKFNIEKPWKRKGSTAKNNVVWNEEYRGKENHEKYKNHLESWMKWKQGRKVLSKKYTLTNKAKTTRARKNKEVSNQTIQNEVAEMVAQSQ